MGRRVLILAAGIGSGHNMAASVLEGCFGRADGVDEVRRLDVLDSTSRLYRSFYDDGYFKLVDAVPWLVGWGYDARRPAVQADGNSVSLFDRINTTSTVRRSGPSTPTWSSARTSCPPGWSRCCSPGRHCAAPTLRGHHRLRLPGPVAEQSPFNRFFVARDETKAYMAAIGVPGRPDERLRHPGPTAASAIRWTRAAVLQALRPATPTSRCCWSRPERPGGSYTTQRSSSRRCG